MDIAHWVLIGGTVVIVSSVLFASVAGVVGIWTLASHLTRLKMERDMLTRRVAELEKRTGENLNPVDDALRDIRNFRLATLAAQDLMDYVAQNSPAAARQIVQTIAPHLYGNGQPPKK